MSIPEPSHAQECRSSRITGPGLPGHCPLSDATHLVNGAGNGSSPSTGMGPGETSWCHWAGTLQGAGLCPHADSGRMELPRRSQGQDLGVLEVVGRRGNETSLKNKRHRPYKSLILKSMKGPESSAPISPGWESRSSAGPAARLCKYPSALPDTSLLAFLR